MYIGDIVSIRYNVHPTTVHEDPEREGSYNSTLSLTSALDRGGWSTPRTGRFICGKENRYQFYRKLAGPQGWPGIVRGNSRPTGTRSPDCPARSESNIVGSVSPLKICALKYVYLTKTEPLDSEQTHAVGQSNA